MQLARIGSSQRNIGNGWVDLFGICKFCLQMWLFEMFLMMREGKGKGAEKMCLCCDDEVWWI